MLHDKHNVNWSLHFRFENLGSANFYLIFLQTIIEVEYLWYRYYIVKKSLYEYIFLSNIVTSYIQSDFNKKLDNFQKNKRDSTSNIALWKLYISIFVSSNKKNRKCITDPNFMKWLNDYIVQNKSFSSRITLKNNYEIWERYSLVLNVK